MRESLAQALELPDAGATEALGKQLARLLPADPAGWTILLEGDLGAGKSTLARAMLREFGHAGPVPSPTYTLVEPYQFAGFVVYHVDLYRIVDTEELEFLGWPELREGLLLVEWPERVKSLAEQADVCIRLTLDDPGRNAAITGLSPRGVELASAITADQV